MPEIAGNIPVIHLHAVESYRVRNIPLLFFISSGFFIDKHTDLDNLSGKALIIFFASSGFI